MSTALSGESATEPTPSVRTVFVSWLRAAADEIHRRTVLNPVASFMVSLVFHTILLIVMALLTVAQPDREQVSLIVSPFRSNEDDLTNVGAAEFSLEGLETPTKQDDDSEPLMRPEAINIPSSIAGEPPVEMLPALPERNWQTSPSVLMERTNEPLGGGIQGRSKDARGKLIEQAGGTAGSEEAVDRALAWLAAHQRPDGSWYFNHQNGPCKGRCPDPGTVGTTTGATAIALLPFLGRNETPKEGDYQEVVRKGVYYLISRMKETRHGGDFQEGTMYAQGLTAICLCEAYALSHDSELKDYAQQSIDFICHAQHPKGGWRYYPGQPGDTTSFGWQLMALKSARLAGLSVPSPVIEKAKGYLDSVQSTNGLFYGYQDRSKENGPTAIGILCRMYTGWSRDDERIRGGIESLAATGPSYSDVYFNYYATQAMRHYEGPHWDRWNRRLREHLITTQAHDGHLAGSWFFPDKHGSIGGRLYTTAMCAMILEVYYRHLPIYSEASIEDGF